MSKSVKVWSYTLITILILGLARVYFKELVGSQLWLVNFAITTKTLKLFSLGAALYFFDVVMALSAVSEFEEIATFLWVRELSLIRLWRAFASRYIKYFGSLLLVHLPLISWQNMSFSLLSLLGEAIVWGVAVSIGFSKSNSISQKISIPLLFGVLRILGMLIVS
ncbi:hypothetical protein QP343_05480 [Lactobacillus jensenii]|uniref:Uncharacterized protein n=1 Tax=Lactobacillus jensenii TaxID=109790 RepID=A0A5N1IEI0_LACJE|nr:hypothetical protein [Lactobacillus jensenii]EEQ68441.1 hypothetical protein LBJG_00869 [Lactobacillus jensenii 1153]ERJ42198.1 hypothetical protein N581_05100 [Lactobacillus jensenii MD IIE-70(2)]MCT7875670.1 hypothetical protein [Lactobacillus iners]APT14210.1 hypothetical protein BUE77_01780 [Lactobacillus jensenii]EEQ24606.1 hypothetical protein LACJE0001_0961 [Lactobacillus jensenii 269-3]